MKAWKDVIKELKASTSPQTLTESLYRVPLNSVEKSASQIYWKTEEAIVSMAKNLGCFWDIKLLVHKIGRAEDISGFCMYMSVTVKII